MMKYADACRKFETFLRVEKNLSPRTRAAYLYDLRRFSDFVIHMRGGRGELVVGHVETEDIRQYIHHLREDLHYRATTLARAISSLRVFFAFCIEQHFASTNPADDIHNPKQARKLPVYLVEQELKKLLAAPDLTTGAGHRDRAMMITMSFCGMRLQEVVGLNLNDVDFESETLRVMGKGSKERLIPMNPDVVTCLKSWLTLRQAAEGEKAVFTNRSGMRISGRMVEKIVDKYVARAGLDRDRLSPHKLRHTFATLLHAHDVDLVEIQTLLGHASISTTQIYTHTDRRRLQSAVEKLDALNPAFRK